MLGPWHGFCFDRIVGVSRSTEATMNRQFAMLGMDPVSVRHDLLIEIGRVELEIDQVIGRDDDLVDADVERLSSKQARLSAALAQLAA